MKTPVEKAHDYATKIINDIKLYGIIVKMSIPGSVKDGDYHETVKKYHPPERLSVDKWRHVTLFPTTNEQINFVHKKAKELFEFGITFDTGGGCNGGRDWEFDWSFTYNENPAEEPLNRLELCNDLIKNISGKYNE